MDQLKENRILATIIAGVLLAAILYFVVSAGAAADAQKAMKPISSSGLRSLDTQVRAAPTEKDVTERKQNRIAMLKALYDTHRLYSRWGFPLHTYTVPGTKRTSSPQDFNSKLVATLATLKDHYETFRKIPQNTKGLTGMLPTDNPYAQEIFNSQDVPRAQKQFWILVEFTNALAQAVEATKRARTDGSAPTCVIRSFKFTEPREDPSGIYTGHPLEVKMALAIDLWPNFRAALHRPDAGDLYWDPSAVERTAVVSRRVGVRFDRVMCEQELANPPEAVEVALATDAEAQQMFATKFPQWTVNGKEITIPKIDEEDTTMKAAKEDAAKSLRFGQLFTFLQRNLLPKRVPASNYVEASLTLEALDFLPAATNSFWKPLKLTAEDVVAILFQGEEEVGDDERSWPKCEATGEPTRNKGTRLDPQVYAIAKGIYSNLEYNPYADNPVRLSEAALLKIAETVIQQLGAPPAVDGQ